MTVNTLEDEDVQLWVLLRQTRDAIYNLRNAEFQLFGLTIMEGGVLMYIDYNDDKITITGLARWLGRTHTAASTLLSRMEKKGLIIKIKDKRRKNAWVIKMGQKGRELFSQASKRTPINDIISILPENKRRELASSLKILRDAALHYRARQLTPPFP